VAALSRGELKTNYSDETLGAAALDYVDEETGAVAMPIRPSTSFLRDPEALDRTGRIFTLDDSPP